MRLTFRSNGLPWHAKIRHGSSSKQSGGKASPASAPRPCISASMMSCSVPGFARAHTWPCQLYESPFTEFSPRGVEGVFDSAQVGQIFSVLDEIRRAAVA